MKPVYGLNNDFVQGLFLMGSSYHLCIRLACSHVFTPPPAHQHSCRTTTYLWPPSQVL